MFINEVKTESIPERVFELGRIVMNGPLPEAEVRERIEPSILNNSSPYYPIIKKAAEEINLINVYPLNENKEYEIKLNVDKEVVSSMAAFRKYCNKYIFANSSWVFYKFTNCFLNSNDNWIQYSNFTDVSIQAYIRDNSDINRNIPDTLRGGRFWLAFLGFAYVYEKTNSSTTILPNMYIALKDFIEMSDIEIDKCYTISEFIGKIRKYASVALDGIDKRKFNFALSSAFRQLHDFGEVVLERKLDSKEVWNMFKDNQHTTLESEITHITVKELIHE